MLPLLIPLFAAGAYYFAKKRNPTASAKITAVEQKLFGPLLAYGPVMPSQDIIKLSPLLAMIGAAESGNDYNRLVGGKRINLVGMTIKEVMAYQSTMIKNGFETTAVGKYQTIASTLKAAVARLGLSDKQKFDALTQDKIAISLMEARGLRSFLSGKMSANSFLLNLSKEWASIPKDMTGKGYYDGVGSNKAHIDPKSVLAQLNTTKTTYA